MTWPLGGLVSLTLMSLLPAILDRAGNLTANANTLNLLQKVHLSTDSVNSQAGPAFRVPDLLPPLRVCKQNPMTCLKIQ